MIHGSCLCGGVRFEIERAVGPFELCHCTRCRKVSGSAYLTWLGVRREHLSEAPPPYDTSFCSRCGSQVPNPSRIGEPWFEIPAGTLDDDPGIQPDKHIYVEFMAPWDHIADDLPQMTKNEIRAHRQSSP
jgi:hypothetical protein